MDLITQAEGSGGEKERAPQRERASPKREQHKTKSKMAANAKWLMKTHTQGDASRDTRTHTQAGRQTKWLSSTHRHRHRVTKEIK